jgi:hypothetical protein
MTPGPDPPAIGGPYDPLQEFPVKGGGSWILTNDKFQQWNQTYRAHPFLPGWGPETVYQHLMNARQWLIDNPTRRKKSVPQFLNNWLRREHEKVRAYWYRHSAPGR